MYPHADRRGAGHLGGNSGPEGPNSHPNFLFKNARYGRAHTNIFSTSQGPSRGNANSVFVFFFEDPRGLNREGPKRGDGRYNNKNIQVVIHTSQRPHTEEAQEGSNRGGPKKRRGQTVVCGRPASVARGRSGVLATGAGVRFGARVSRRCLDA